MILEVHGYRVRSLNKLLRGTHYKHRAAERRRELGNIRTLLRTQNPRPARPLSGPLIVDFCVFYAGCRPDVDGRWKLVGDALQGDFIVDDGQVEVLTQRRHKVAHRHEEGFLVKLTEVEE